MVQQNVAIALVLIFIIFAITAALIAVAICFYKGTAVQYQKASLESFALEAASSDEFIGDMDRPHGPPPRPPPHQGGWTVGAPPSIMAIRQSAPRRGRPGSAGPQGPPLAPGAVPIQYLHQQQQQQQQQQQPPPPPPPHRHRHSKQKLEAEVAIPIGFSGAGGPSGGGGGGGGGAAVAAAGVRSHAPRTMVPRKVDTNSSSGSTPRDAGGGGR